MIKKMKAIFKPPRYPYTGNLIWEVGEALEFSSEIQGSLERIRSLGYFASPFPEGDGISFTDETKSKKDMGILNDFRSSFEWLNIGLDLTFSKKLAKAKPTESKLSFEKPVVLTKSEIAMLQLEDAIDLFMSGKRISAITLAGAADGIFAGLLEQRGDTSAAEDTWKYIEEVREKTGVAYAGNRTKKEVFNEWNEHRNRLKHHDKRASCKTLRRKIPDLKTRLFRCDFLMPLGQLRRNSYPDGLLFMIRSKGFPASADAWYFETGWRGGHCRNRIN